MDYKEKYETAIERLRNAFYSNNSRMCDEYRKAVVGTIEPIFPELKESEDGKIRREIVDFICWEVDRGSITSEQREKSNSWLAWLGKKREQKEDITRAKIAEYLKKLILDQSQRGAHMLDYEGRIEEEVDFIIGIAKKELKNEKQGEQRFKVEKDKWYVCVSQFLNCIKGRCYKATSDGRIIDDYGTEYDMHDDAYKWFRPWTIQDAKKGNILVDSYNNIGIFKKCEGTYWHSYIYLGCDGELRGITNMYYSHSIAGMHKQIDTHPATKEQCDALMEAMSDAGYTFNFENKELKKIERKPAEWSKEDEGVLLESISVLQNNSHWILADKLKSIKDRVQPQPKQEWSEEEKKRVDRIINVLDWAEDKGRISYSDWEDYVTYVRCLRPQPNTK